MTPLYMAAQENHIDVAKELLYHSANPHLAASVRKLHTITDSLFRSSEFMSLPIIFHPKSGKRFSFLLVLW